MSTPLLTRAPHKAQPSLPFIGDLTLAAARVHEFCGPARRSLALLAARQLEGPIFWISSQWQTDRLHGRGLCQFIDPARLHFVTPKTAEDCLWSMEEVLRAGCVPLVVAELPEPPPLTPIRRLHLAAEAGAARGIKPLGLILSPGDGGAQGVETRWHIAGAHRPDHTGWHLERRRARIAAPKAWAVHWNHGKLGVSLATGAVQKP